MAINIFSALAQCEKCDDLILQIFVNDCKMGLLIISGHLHKSKGQLLSGDEAPEPLLKSPKEKKKDPVPLIQGECLMT